LENEQLVNNKTLHPSLLAMLIWILTSATLGTGWFFYSVLFEANRDVWISIPVAIGAAVLSLPVFLALCIAVPFIKNLSLHPVGKIKRLLVTCFMCTLPYALVISSFPASNYVHNYVLNVLAVSGVLFSCSIIAMLITGRIIKQIFSAGVEYTFSFDQISEKIEPEQHAAGNG
jgi:hypothetical protein